METPGETVPPRSASAGVIVEGRGGGSKKERRRIWGGGKERGDTRAEGGSGLAKPFRSAPAAGEGLLAEKEEDDPSEGDAGAPALAGGRAKPLEAVAEADEERADLPFACPLEVVAEREGAGGVNRAGVVFGEEEDAGGRDCCGGLEGEDDGELNAADEEKEEPREGDSE
jgi:hypothetical protein